MAIRARGWTIFLFVFVCCIFSLKKTFYMITIVFSKSEREQSREFIHLTISKICLPVSYTAFESIRKKYRLIGIKSTKANVYSCIGEQPNALFNPYDF